MEEKSTIPATNETVVNEKSPAHTIVHDLSFTSKPPEIYLNDVKSSILGNEPRLPLGLSVRKGQTSDGFSSILSPTETKPHLIVSHNSFDGDLESQTFDTQQTQASVSKTGLLNKTSYDPMWPNRQDLKRKRKAIKRERACCSCWGGLSRNQRSIISTLIILVVLGAGLSVGFGISKRVGGGVVSSKGPNAPVLFR